MICKECEQDKKPSEMAVKRILVNNKLKYCEIDVCRKCDRLKEEYERKNIKVNEFNVLSKYFLQTHFLMPTRWEMTLC